ncbi:MAG: hypothetical protein ACYC56_07555 [Candidatus Aquicultor sp.]
MKMQSPAARHKISADHIVIGIVAAAIVLSLFTAIFYAVGESSAMGVYTKDALEQHPSPGSMQQSRAEKPKPTIEPLSLVPSNIKDFSTNAHHETPGSDGRAAEAIYQPQGDRFTQVMPLNSYVLVSYQDNDEQAAQEIRKTLEGRFPKDRKDIQIETLRASSGFSNDSGSYFTGWVYQGFSVKIITTYINAVPANPEIGLQKVGDILSQRINLYISNPKYRKGDQTN